MFALQMKVGARKGGQQQGVQPPQVQQFPPPQPQVQRPAQSGPPARGEQVKQERPDKREDRHPNKKD